MIGTIENALIARLDRINDAGALGYNLRQIKSYSGELRSQAERARMKDFPAAWLAFDGADPVQDLNGFVKMRGRWTWLVATENFRNEKASRHGAGGDVGVYQIGTDLISIFAGKKPAELEDGAEVLVAGAEAVKNMSIRPVSVDDSRNGRLAIYAVPLTCDFQIKKTTPDVDLTNPLEVIHANWDLPPTGEVGPDLPDDDSADATSHITGD
ncbi:MAG: DUF1834 family protein [Alphaproteobacteria bacterium]|jgi:phage gp37-like protein|nr:DUF1834 family protein [Alphaproteobacteria bacterium]